MIEYCSDEGLICLYEERGGDFVRKAKVR